MYELTLPARIELSEEEEKALQNLFFAYGKARRLCYSLRQKYELRGRDIEFILLNILNSDYLFISKKDWEELREYGLVRLGYYISVKIEKAIRKDGTEVPLYTKRDIEI